MGGRRWCQAPLENCHLNNETVSDCYLSNGKEATINYLSCTPGIVAFAYIYLVIFGPEHYVQEFADSEFHKPSRPGVLLDAQRICRLRLRYSVAG